MLEDVRLAIIVNPDLSPGHLANTIAAVSIGMGAAMPALGGRRLTDRQEATIDISSNMPVPVLQADSRTIGTLLAKTLPRQDGRVIVALPTTRRPSRSATLARKSSTGGGSSAKAGGSSP